MSATLQPAGIRLIVGLGNPGREYRDTRHNVGFMIVEQLAERERADFRTEKNWQCEIARAGDLLLCKPLTYMNLSGQAVSAVSRFYKIEPAQMLIVLDDFALPFGKLRLRPGGSAGGHNGLQSVIEHAGTQTFPRLRVGIGAAENSTVDHVLGRFTLEEQPVLTQSLTRSLEAIDFARRHGIPAAMNAFN